MTTEESNTILVGLHFAPNDEELVKHLQLHDAGRTPPSSGVINMAIDAYSNRPDRLPNINKNGSYYYTDRDALTRRTLDDSGYWRSKEGQKPIHNRDGNVVGFKRKFEFRLGNYKNWIQTKWIMTEYTLCLDKYTGGAIRKALCAIHMTAGNGGNGIGEASTSEATDQPLPHYTNYRDVLMEVATYLDEDCEPPEFNDMDI